MVGLPGGIKPPTPTGGGFDVFSLLSGPLAGGAGIPGFTGGAAHSAADSFASNQGDFSYSAPFTFGGSGGGVNTPGVAISQPLILGAIALGAFLLWRKM